MSDDRPMDTGKPEAAAPVVRIEVDAPDNLDSEQMRVLDALGLSDGEADFEVSPSQQFDSLEDGFRDDHAWLDQLARRYERVPARAIS